MKKEGTNNMIRDKLVKLYCDAKYQIYRFSPKELYPFWLKFFYKFELGKKLDLNNPKTLNEKIQWLKIYDATPEKTRLADKYLVREWIKEKIGEQYLIPLIGVWDSPDDIDFSSLPEKFVLKCNHGSSCNIIVEDKKKLDIESAKRDLKKWLKINYSWYNCELHYSPIPRKIICEKYIENIGGLRDYRFYCYNGEPNSVWVDIFSGTPNHKRNIFDLNWNVIPVKCKWPSGNLDEFPKPTNYDKMVELARKLSEDFLFVRVDFYEVDSKIYFGEMTFTPMQGTAAFSPDEYDLIFGNLLHLPQK